MIEIMNLRSLIRVFGAHLYLSNQLSDFIGLFIQSGKTMNMKIVAIAAVAVVVIAAAAGAIVLTNNDDDNEKGGLYSLDATVLNVDMGGMSSTPKMVETVKYMYSEVYGDLYDGANSLTINDAKNDAEFWNKYCSYTPLVTVNGDGSMTYKTVTNSNTKILHDLTIPNTANKLIATGTAYPTNIYYALCEKYNEEPYSKEALANSDLVSEFQSINYGGLVLNSIKNSSEELAKYYGSDYVESCSSLKSYDLENVGNDVKNAVGTGNTVILMGSGTIAKDMNAEIYNKVTVNKGYMALNTATSIPSTLAGIELVCTLFGYGEEASKIIEKMEIELYQIYWSIQHKSEDHKAYFEGSNGKASKSSGSGAELCEFLGFDISLFTGSEVDTETLLSEKPDVLIYYTNDDRSDDEKMRVSS